MADQRPNNELDRIRWALVQTERATQDLAEAAIAVHGGRSEDARKHLVNATRTLGLILGQHGDAGPLLGPKTKPDTSKNRDRL